MPAPPPVTSEESIVNREPANTVSTVLVSGRLMIDRLIRRWVLGRPPGIWASAGESSDWLVAVDRKKRMPSNATTGMLVSVRRDLRPLHDASRPAAESTAKAVLPGWLVALTLVTSEPPSSSIACTDGSAPTVSTLTSRSSVLGAPAPAEQDRDPGRDAAHHGTVVLAVQCRGRARAR